MKKRLFFNKYEEMKYISHLDLLRFMDRILRKSGIPVKYSQGFHPRPKISLGNPISLGTDAFNEAMDIELREDMTNEELFKRLNNKCVIGFEFTKVMDIDGKTSIAEEYKEMKFEIQGPGSSLEKIENLLGQDEIILTKEKKGKIESKDLKPRIKNYEIDKENNKITMILENMSPNSLLNICGVKAEDVSIKKYGMIEI
ncbi:MAG: TIGR03936 family radical SAM-associated protein [Fusobacterium sp.]|nr:TIGR03936 family radical SAM-associated protein [Fusobacterium sp.]